jgi:hypothetical protein
MKNVTEEKLGHSMLGIDRQTKAEIGRALDE